MTIVLRSIYEDGESPYSYQTLSSPNFELSLQKFL